MHAADVLFHTLKLRPALAPDELAVHWASIRPDGLAALVAWEHADSWTLRRLTETGCLASAPAALVDALKQRVRKEAARNMLVDAEAARVVDRLTADRVPFVLLKGTARRALAGRFPCIETRSTSDVDILLPDGAAAGFWEGMRAAGYQESSDERPHHLAPLMGEGRVAVELHTSLAHGMEPAEAWRRSTQGGRAVEWSGRQALVPGATEMLWHALAHALKADLPVPWKLRAFLEAASLMAGPDDVDWNTIAQRLGSREVPDTRLARAWLGAAAQLTGMAPPAEVLGDGPAFDVMIMLRWRLDVLARHEDEGYGARLLEEGTRVELGLEPAPTVPGSGILKQTRRRLGGRAARLAYQQWRAKNARGASS